MMVHFTEPGTVPSLTVSAGGRPGGSGGGDGGSGGEGGKGGEGGEEGGKGGGGDGKVQVHPLQSHSYSCSSVGQGYPLSIHVSHVCPKQLAVQPPDIGR